MSREHMVEFVGALWLVLGGCGSAVLAAKFPEVGIGLVGVALAFGFTVLTRAYAFGHIAVIEELIRETEERLMQIENNVPHQKNVQPHFQGRCRDEDLSRHSPRP